MDSKKIALFIPELGGGGAERMMVNFAHGFVKQGAEVDIALIRKEGPYLPLVSSSVRIVDVQAQRLVYIGTQSSYFEKLTKSSAKLVRHSRYIAFQAFGRSK